MDIYEDLDLGGVIMSHKIESNASSLTSSPCSPVTAFVANPVANYNRGQTQCKQQMQQMSADQKICQQNNFHCAYCNMQQQASQLKLGCRACILDTEGALNSVLPHSEDDYPLHGIDFNNNKWTRDSAMQYNINMVKQSPTSTRKQTSHNQDDIPQALQDNDKLSTQDNVLQDEDTNLPTPTIFALSMDVISDYTFNGDTYFLNTPDQLLILQ
eukprot:14059994-Ditylum_brightwellii.AAC.1